MADKAKEEYSPGLEGVIAGESALCEVDEGAAGLRYRGYAIGDLAEKATFEEVAYLLLFGKLPTRKELGDFTAQLQTQWPLPGPVEAFIGVVPPSAHPMDILRTGVSLLGMTDPDAADFSRDANLRKSVRLLAQIPILIANAYRLAHAKRQVQPKQEMSFAENLLYLLTDRHDDEQAKVMARVLNVSLILYAEHEFNASTFAARVAASTLTDLHAAVTAAIAALKGPLRYLSRQLCTKFRRPPTNHWGHWIPLLRSSTRLYGRVHSIPISSSAASQNQSRSAIDRS